MCSVLNSEGLMAYRSKEKDHFSATFATSLKAFMAENFNLIKWDRLNLSDLDVTHREFPVLFV